MGRIDGVRVCIGGVCVLCVETKEGSVYAINTDTPVAEYVHVRLYIYFSSTRDDKISFQSSLFCRSGWNLTSLHTHTHTHTHAHTSHCTSRRILSFITGSLSRGILLIAYTTRSTLWVAFTTDPKPPLPNSCGFSKSFQAHGLQGV